MIPRDAMLMKVHLAFLAHGYEGMTMITLAKELGCRAARSIIISTTRRGRSAP